MNHLNLTRTQRNAIGGFLASSFGAAAQAAAVDVTALVTDVGAQIVSIASVGAAVLLVYIAVKAFKWVRRALS